MKSSRHLAIVAAAGLFAGGIAISPAQAADLGGDCCADLEERIAELEATTVRKGNRKVSLTLSGHVNQALVWYDASNTAVGPESDVYVLDNGNSMTRVRLKGSAKFKPGWSAGFYIELGVRDANSYGVGPNDADDSASILIRHANWYIKADRLGTVTVGQGSEATDGITEIDLSGTFAVSYGGGEGPLTIANFGVNSLLAADGGRINMVRYDTPTIAGLTFSASWGEDDRWSAALRYKREYNGLRFAAGIGYTWTNDEFAPNPMRLAGDREMIGASVALWHVPTGLFLTAAYHDVDRDFDFETAALPDAGGEHWYLKAGIRRRFNALGQTSIYGEYGQSSASTTVAGVTTAENDVNYYGVGVVQYIDAAAMELYLGWRRYEDDDSVTSVGGLDNDSLDQITAGGRIKF